MSQRDRLVEVANSYIGHREPTGDDKFIKWFGGYALTVPWCHIFLSYCANKAELSTNIIPKTASCDTGMEWFKGKKLWYNSKAYGGSYTPQKGDIVYYSSTRNQKDSTHVGIVETVENGKLEAIEGNKSDAVGKRLIALDNDYILGYGTPPYTDEADKTQGSQYKQHVGKGIGLATSKTPVNVRDGADTSHNIVGYVKKDFAVEVLGVLNNGWLQVVWTSSPKGYAYVSNVGDKYFDLKLYNKEPEYEEKKYKSGEIVSFTGSVHYSSANATKGAKCKPGKAKVTQVAAGKRHEYHLVREAGGGSNVYGWVDKKDIQGPYTYIGYDEWAGVVNTYVLNVRKGPGIEYNKIAQWPQLLKGSKVIVLGEHKATNGKVWYRINIKGNIGYVNSAYIDKV